MALLGCWYHSNGITLGYDLLVNNFSDAKPVACVGIRLSSQYSQKGCDATIRIASGRLSIHSAPIVSLGPATMGVYKTFLLSLGSSFIPLKYVEHIAVNI